MAFAIYAGMAVLILHLAMETSYQIITQPNAILVSVVFFLLQILVVVLMGRLVLRVQREGLGNDPASVKEFTADSTPSCSPDAGSEKTGP